MSEDFGRGILGLLLVAVVVVSAAWVLVEPGFSSILALLGGSATLLATAGFASQGDSNLVRESIAAARWAARQPRRFAALVAQVYSAVFTGIFAAIALMGLVGPLLQPEMTWPSSLAIAFMSAVLSAGCHFLYRRVRAWREASSINTGQA